MRDRKNDHVHREVLERKLGRPLRRDEVADHVDEDKTNNAPDNLRVKTRSAHSRDHAKGPARRVSGIRASLRMTKERKKLY